MKYPSIVLKPGKERPVRNRHPWIFSGAVKNQPKAGDGDIVEVLSADGTRLAYGHYAPGRTLVCRMFAFTGEELEIGDAYWHGKLMNAWNYRKALPGMNKTTGFRLVHAEGDGLPGIVIDIFDKVACVQLRTSGARTLEGVIQSFLVNEMGIASIFVQTEEKGDKKAEPDEAAVAHGHWIMGGEAEAEFEENGIRYFADIEGGQKTGFFLDQRDNRRLLKSFASGKRVANLFAYTGGFSLSALAGGATEVISVDLSESANALCRRNVEENFANANHTALRADCFQYLKDMEQGRWDLIVLDPPAFTKHASTVDRAARGYKEINMKAMQKIAPGGFLFTFSCSQHLSKDLFRKVAFAAAADAGREVRVVSQLTQAPDHPISIFHPEGEYLKGLVLEIS